MNEINRIFTTISSGQVHIAADTKYLGSVDSYNNCLTQFFAWLFGRSMTVNFDGKLLSVNKKSYTKLVCSLTRNAEMNDIRHRSLFRPIAEAATLPQHNLKMRDVISNYDSQVLFKKLAYAISQGDTNKALLMIGKGATLDQAYFDRDQLTPSFKDDTDDLKTTSSYAFTTFLATPILQAARKGNLVVCQFLKDAGANLTFTGRQYNFRREITNVDIRLEPVEEPRFVPSHQQANPNGKDRDSDLFIKQKPVLKQRVIVSTKDSRLDSVSYRLDQDNLNVVEI